MSKSPQWVSQINQWFRDRKKLWWTSGTVAGLVIILRLTGVLQTWEWSAYDTGFRLRPQKGLDERILIVTVDETDIQWVGTWPFPDRLLANLIQRLQAANPQAIGIDIYRDLPVPPGHSTLEAVMENTPNLVMIEKLEDSQSVGVPPPDLDPDAIGFNNIVTDGDGKVRRMLLYWHIGEDFKTSFALRLAQLYLQDQEISPQPAQINPEYLQLGQAVFRPLQPNDGAYVRLDTKGYQVLANFRHPDLFATVSLREVLTGQVSPGQIRDRIIVVGSTAPSLKDFAFIPYSTSLFKSLEPIHGVELHANFVSYIISAALGEQALIRVLNPPLAWLWIVLWSGVGGIIVTEFRSLIRSSVGLLLATGGLWGTVYLAFLGGWWIPIIPPFLALGSTAIILTGYRAYQEEEMKRSMEFLRSIIDNIPDPIFVKDQNYRWIVLNQAYCRFSGYSREQLLGKTEQEIFPPAEARVFRQQAQWVFNYQQSKENEEKFTDKSGTTYLTATKRSLHRDAAGNIFLVGVIRDITERKRVEEELRRTTDELSRSNAELRRAQNRLQQLAYYDSLTGLANRKSFYESLRTTLEWGKKNNQLVGLLYLDLNGFKQVNDTLGHPIGDLLLKAVAGRIKNCLRESDTVARLGGDEFTVILPGIKNPGDVEIVAKKISGTLSEKFALDDHFVSVTVSIGHSVYPRDGDTEEILINLADHAMYRAKSLSRKR
ncbi:CHASE2 domain-containing protein [Spirulina sp. CS-785/01]|uniref:CHASE2 domain-containing protein n=1 Tax=Spirulina sp. CS-785/01 TaxID=3021716 RepID=UPI00232D8F41|nr:CHASE2 domain-containing protein [Spirulina sp. CS-785/01]MDB9311546.1 CHASE2 domain-containing protein [Spirulina sp. CS-785/01]